MRELNYEEVQAQAKALWGYVQRGGNAVKWLRSKAFTTEDQGAICAAYTALLKRAGRG